MLARTDDGLTRRKFIAGCAATTAAVGFVGCGSDDGEDVCVEPGPDNNVDQRLFSDYRELAQLDFFELDDNGRLHCTVDIPPAHDVHTHLALAFYNAPPVDLLANHDRVQYLFDCNVEGASCPIDLDLYANASLSERVVEEGSNAIIDFALTGTEEGPILTHTIPNLVAEMDDLGLGKSWLLPIAMNFDYDADNPSEGWQTAVQEAGVEDRLVCFGSVHPDDPNKVSKLERMAELGMVGIKIHPSTQTISPDTDGAMEVYQECDRLGLPIFFHAGRTGLETMGGERYVEWEKYLPGIREFPNLDFILGHSGARYNGEDAIALARENQNCWMCLAGPSIPIMELMLEELGPERMLYGTDWPFYPQAMQLAKILIMTRCDRTVRDMILAENAERFLEKWA